MSKDKELPTKSDIESMTPPMLRRWVKRVGENPLSEKFGRGSVEKMRAFLAAQVVNETAAVEPATPARAEATAREKDGDIWSFVESLQRRVEMLEQRLNVSHAGLEDPLKRYRQFDAKAGVYEYVVTPEQVHEMTGVDCYHFGALVGLDFSAFEGREATVRGGEEMRALLLERLAQLGYRLTSNDEPAVAKDVTDAEPKYKKGDFVAVFYAGKKFNKCRIDDVVQRGGKFEYEVYFQADGSSVSGYTDEEIIGKSKPF